MELKDSPFSLDLLLQETLNLTEQFARESEAKSFEERDEEINSLNFFENEEADYLFDLADRLLEDGLAVFTIPNAGLMQYPEGAGVIYRLDEAMGTFCIRGFSSANVRKSMESLQKGDEGKRALLKISADADFSQVFYFKTNTFEIAEGLKDQIMNRRFPKEEDAVCNISDPGFSWWMNVGLTDAEGRFEIFLKSHSVNRAENSIQLGPLGDGLLAAARFNQAYSFFKNQFPLSEFVCTEKSFLMATSKPDHLGFISLKNIFLLGENYTSMDDFPDDAFGRMFFQYLQEIASIRKFWIEVQRHLS